MPLVLRPVIIATLGAVVVTVGGCSESRGPAQTQPPPPKVTVQKPIQRKVVDHDEYVGRFTAINSVEIRARVSGYLDSVHFKDGQIVHAGDLLFTIDRRPFQNALDQARANLALARSNLTYAEADLARGQKLVKENTISQQVYQQRVQAKRNAEASVQASEAAARQAQLDLEFTQLKSPIDGRIGDRQVTPGNLVTGGTGGNTTLLATIVSNDPIYFEFTFDEASYLHYERVFRIGRKIDKAGGGLPVELKLIDEKDFMHRGELDFVNNVIDRSTGTIRGRAIFKNPKELLTPGMFARIRVPASPSYLALLVPDSAIGSEQSRKYVLVVDSNNIAREKYVTLGQLVDNKLRVIKSGLTADDRVIVEGLMHAHANAKVTPESPDLSRQAEAAPSPAN